MKTCAAYLLGLIFALVLAAGITTIPQEPATGTALGYAQSLQSSITATHPAAHIKSSEFTFLLCESSSSCSQNLVQRLRVPVRIAKQGFAWLPTDHYDTESIYNSLSGQYHHCEQTYLHTPRGVDYYVYTLRKIII